jgi:hypothetical protein
MTAAPQPAVPQPAAPPETPARAAPDAEPYGLAPPPGPHPLTRRRLWGPLALLLGLLSLPFLHLALRGPAKTTTTVPFADEFDRAELGEHWFSTGGHWRPVEGWLYSPGVKNNPLWLRATLPADVAVEFDVKATEDTGDLKVEIFGNGRDHASGYVLIFGGWKNTISIIARLDEHGRDRLERRDRKVERDRTYHFRIERRGAVLRWLIDGERFLEFDDPAPLVGSGHDRFGFSSWASDARFDNLRITPL